MSKIDLREVYAGQKFLETSLNLDTDNINIIQWYNSLTSAIVEISEVLAEDTRWKKLINNNNKPPKVNRENVIEETADVVLYLINSCIFYGISIEELLLKIDDKQQRNIERLLYGTIIK